jgi:hypothetical protein
MVLDTTNLKNEKDCEGLPQNPHFDVTNPEKNDTNNTTNHPEGMSDDGPW